MVKKYEEERVKTSALRERMQEDPCQARWQLADELRDPEHTFQSVIDLDDYAEDIADILSVLQRAASHSGIVKGSPFTGRPRDESVQERQARGRRLYEQHEAAKLRLERWLRRTAASARALAGKPRTDGAAIKQTIKYRLWVLTCDETIPIEASEKRARDLVIGLLHSNRPMCRELGLPSPEIPSLDAAQTMVLSVWSERTAQADWSRLSRKRRANELVKTALLALGMSEARYKNLSTR